MEIIKRIAKKNNTAPEEVLQEMQTAIEAAYCVRRAKTTP